MGTESVPNDVVVRTLELLNGGGNVTISPFDDLTLEESVEKVVQSVMCLDELKVPAWVRLGCGGQGLEEPVFYDNPEDMRRAEEVRKNPGASA